MRRADSLLSLACIALTVSCGPSKRDADRELGLATQVSEQLTTEFADAGAEGSAPRRGPIGSTEAALAAADSVEQGGIRQASIAAAGQPVAILEACPAPRIDASGFQRMNVDPIPISITAPSNYELHERRTRVVGQDTMTATIDAGGDHLWFMRGQYDRPYHDMSEWNVVSHCDDMVSGMHVHFDSAIKKGSTYGRGVSASFQLPTGAWLIVQGQFHDVESARAALYALRTVQFKSVWSP